MHYRVGRRLDNFPIEVRCLTFWPKVRRISCLTKAERFNGRTSGVQVIRSAEQIANDQGKAALQPSEEPKGCMGVLGPAGALKGSQKFAGKTSGKDVKQLKRI